MRPLKIFSILFSFYSLLSIINLTLISNMLVSIFSIILGLIASFFLRKEFKNFTSRIEFKIPYAGSYLMLLGYMGIIIGIPTSSISAVHLLGITLVLIGALFVDIGILTALVVGGIRLYSLWKNKWLVIISVIFLFGLILSFPLHRIGDIFYMIASILTFMKSPS
ncbi:hypothetical protein V6M85_08330 [Sulfolobus tengchongensis]|uniref:Uncharacterized protein n=1 Tax=Sulfolobus tengchongensis TaxID=207809 RepID=A0AAX4KXM6_9CREN